MVSTFYLDNTGHQQVFLDCMPTADQIASMGLVAMSATDIAAYAAASAATVFPNPTQFAQDVKTALGGIVAANALMIAYPAFFPAVTNCEWSDLQLLIEDAVSKSAINATQYSAIKTAATNNNIPISLT